MTSEAGPRAETAFLPMRIGLPMLAGLWILQFVLLTAIPLASTSSVDGIPGREVLARRAIACGLGAVLSYGVALALKYSSSRSLWQRVLFGFCLAALAATAQSAINIAVFYIFWPSMAWATDADKIQSVYLALIHYWFWFYLAWIGVYLAILYNRGIVERDQRLAEAQMTAQQAQLAALRYQISPHFLFNALNSLSSLILDGENRKAETMVQKLSSFFRSTLSSDPKADIKLSDELDLQRSYLEIEKVRFEERIQIDIDVPEILRRALVPTLILQPLMENAVKHGVARSKSQTRIEIEAYVKHDMLVIEVRNDAPPHPAGPRGAARPAGVGLKNVRSRVLARGSGSRFEANDTAGGGYAVRLTMPLQFDRG